MKVGDKVKWSSQAQGKWKTKEGVVTRIVPTGKLANLKPSNTCLPRDHESYVVKVGKKLYWPRVAALKLVEEAPCECVNWCRDGRDMSPHHPRCKHYTPDPPDPRYAVFGFLMWEMIRKLDEEFCWSEWSEEVLPIAQKAGLCKRVAYDPEKHGLMVDADKGDMIWFWGDEKTGGEA